MVVSNAGGSGHFPNSWDGSCVGRERLEGTIDRELQRHNEFRHVDLEVRIGRWLKKGLQISAGDEGHDMSPLRWVFSQ